MSNILITFGDEKYNGAISRLKQSALDIGKVDEVITYSPSDFTDSFKNGNGYVLSKPRGYGFWIWKPWIIRQAFNELEYGDVVLYSDAGLSVTGDLSVLFEVAKNSKQYRVLFKLPAHGVDAHKAKTWCKRDCFVLMNCDHKLYWESDMINGAVSLWVKTDDNIEILKEWSRYMKDPRIVTDELNFCGKPNFLEFKDHRHDQSVLTLLSTKYDFEMFRDPTQFGEMDIDKYNNSPYGTLFNHHRQKN
jgi:hypothetical protein